jgi:hypothetical protein
MKRLREPDWRHPWLMSCELRELFYSALALGAMHTDLVPELIDAIRDCLVALYACGFQPELCVRPQCVDWLLANPGLVTSLANDTLTVYADTSFGRDRNFILVCSMIGTGTLFGMELVPHGQIPARALIFAHIDAAIMKAGCMHARVVLDLTLPFMLANEERVISWIIFAKLVVTMALDSPSWTPRRQRVNLAGIHPCGVCSTV